MRATTSRLLLAALLTLGTTLTFSALAAPPTPAAAPTLNFQTGPVGILGGEVEIQAASR